MKFVICWQNKIYLTGDGGLLYSELALEAEF